jgi:hypothetical protein
MVKESPSKPAATRAPERLKKVGNTDLPIGTNQRLWRRSFVSTYMQFAASQPDPWDIPAGIACQKLQIIWDAIFPEIDYAVTATSAVYLLVSGSWNISTLLTFFWQILQRLADSWRCAIGSTALSVLIAFFESQDQLRNSNENCAEWSEYALDKLRFCYKKADGDDEDVSVYLTCMLFILTLLNAGFSGTLSRYLYCSNSR